MKQWETGVDTSKKRESKQKEKKDYKEIKNER